MKSLKRAVRRFRVKLKRQRKSDFSTSRDIFKRDSGAALLMAIFCVTMLMVIATEVMYETNVELQVSSQSVNEVKAHYAAQAGVEISLLRIFIFRKAAALVGDSPLKSMLDPIWQVPFTWPPLVPDTLNAVDKDQIKKSVKESKMEGQYLATIEPESAKLDINDLASPLKGVVDNTKTRLKDIFTAKMESDEKFQRKWQGFDFDQLISNIKDYVDEDKVSDDGQPENAKYSDLNLPDFYPPNQPFKTLQEIHMVAGMTDELFDVLVPNITIYGNKGINVNYASKDMIKSLDPVQFTDERVGKILEARNDPQRGPFKDDKDFLGFTGGLGIRDDWYKDEQGKPKILLLFDSEYNFRVRSTGKSGKIQKDIVAVVYDYNKTKARLKTLADMMKPSPTPNLNVQNPPVQQTATPTPAPSTDDKTVPAERPNIVYWNET